MNNTTLRQLQQILGYSISSTEGKRTYTPIDGVLYVDLFTGELPEEIEGVRAFNGEVNGLTYFNEIIIADKCEKEYSIELNWGSEEFNSDIEQLIEWLEEQNIGDTLDSAEVKSKKIEDFNITFNGYSDTRDNQRQALLATYSWFIRRMLIIDVAGEQKDGGFYF